MGGIGPYLGELWGFEKCDFGVLWPIFSRNPLVRFLIFFANRKYLQSSFDSENLKKIYLGNFEKSALKFGKNAFSTEYFRVVRGLNNGVMVTAPGVDP